MRRQCTVHRTYELGKSSAMRIPRNNCAVCWKIHFEQCKAILGRFGYGLEYALTPLQQDWSPEPRMDEPVEDFMDGTDVETMHSDKRKAPKPEEVEKPQDKTYGEPEIGSEEWLKDALGR